MTSWYIWYILRNPTYGHPLFRRVLLNRRKRSGGYKAPQLLLDARFLIELMAGLFICAAMFSPIFMILAVIGIFLLMNGTLVGSFWALKTSGTIARERENGAYDLYCLAPEGALSVNWAICTGSMHRDKRLEQIHRLVRSLLGMGLVTIVIILVIIAISILQGGPHTSDPEATYRSALMLIQATALLAILYIDHVHSIVLSSLVSILVPTYTRGRFDAQLGTVGVYLLLQIASYLAAWFVCLTLLPTFYDGMSDLSAQMVLAALQVIAFYAIREALISFLWRRLAVQLNLAPVEQHIVPRPAEKLRLKAP